MVYWGLMQATVARPSYQNLPGNCCSLGLPSQRQELIMLFVERLTWLSCIVDIPRRTVGNLCETVKLSIVWKNYPVVVGGDISDTGTRMPRNL